ncbi:ABC transporter ATP-binding protein [Clostridium sediminicola]|uniref:ABC transporter ATP-binding protein n=1 Tax=Clostridium sediminicola TaxID=3114879 RepID=UPI0031F203D7
MIHTRIRSLTKKYGNIVAIDSLDLDIYDGEILAVVGPSGCGKTTLLSIIAGLIKPDEGALIIGEEAVSSVKEGIFKLPEKREIGLVFQNYAVWPHKSVFENIAYPLKIRKEKKTIINEEVKKMLRLVKLSEKEKCYPHELSGGEKQRVALARALIMKPKLLLLDESLSNLDAKLREEMQYEIKQIHKELGVTIVHVTHDQYEAMGIADRIVVMNKGKVVQIDTPRKLYDSPKSQFISNFIGKSNILKSKVVKSKNLLKLEILKDIFIEDKYSSGKVGEKVILSVRPEDIILNSAKELGKGKIISSVYKGNMIEYELRVGDRILKVQTNSKENYKVGEKVSFDFYRVISVLDS